MTQMEMEGKAMHHEGTTPGFTPQNESMTDDNKSVKRTIKTINKPGSSMEVTKSPTNEKLFLID